MDKVKQWRPGTWESKNIPDTRLGREVSPSLGMARGRPAKGEREKIDAERREPILAVVRRATGPVTAAEISERIGGDRGNKWVSATLRKMVLGGQVKKYSKIKYVLEDHGR